jgi:hypothetical protein
MHARTSARLDHLVVAAADLEQGLQWCERSFGLRPEAGGPHPLMGTHNRIFSIASEPFPQAYLEIIAIDPKAPPRQRRPGQRWFDLDDAALQASLARGGPRLIHFVARVEEITAAAEALASTRIDRGEVIEAARDTPAGRLSWRITVRADGQRLFYGALPTLIEWGAVHPTDSLPACGIALRSLALAHPRVDDLQAAFQAIALRGPVLGGGPPNLRALLDTPGGSVTLESHGI